MRHIQVLVDVQAGEEINSKRLCEVIYGAIRESYATDNMGFTVEVEKEADE